MRSSRNDDSTISAKRKALITAKRLHDEATARVEVLEQQQQEHTKTLQNLDNDIQAARARIQELEDTEQAAITELEREIEPLLSWLRARPTNLLALFPFTPGTGTFQERIDALNIDIDIPPEFLGEYVKDKIDANGKVLEYNKPVIMDEPIKVGKLTYEDLGQLRDIAIAKYGENYVKNHFPKYWFNPCTGQKINEEATIDEDFRQAIESFVLIQEIAHHTRFVFERQADMLDPALKEQALAAAKALGKTDALPALLNKTTQEIVDSIPSAEDHFPNFLHQQCVAIDDSPGLMTFPVSIKDGNSSWSLDFSEVRDHKRALPAPKPHPKKYSVTQLKIIHQNNMNRLLLDKVRHTKNAEVYGYCETTGKQLDVKTDKHEIDAEIERIRIKYDALIEKEKSKHLDECKPVQIQQQAVAAHFYNPFLQEARWVRGLTVHTADLKQLDSILENILINAVDGLKERLAEISRRKNKYVADIEEQKTDVIYHSELEIKRLKGELEKGPRELEDLQKTLPNLKLKLMRAQLELDKALEDERASIDDTLENGKRSFQDIILHKNYPQRLLPESVPIQIKGNHTEVMTHPVLLDGEYVIDYADLMKTWETQSYALGFWQYKGKPGINPFTNKPVTEFRYAKELRRETKAFIRNIGDFKQIIAEHEAAKRGDDPTDLKDNNKPAEKPIQEVDRLEDLKDIQLKLNALQKSCVARELIASPFALFTNTAYAPACSAAFIASSFSLSKKH